MTNAVIIGGDFPPPDHDIWTGPYELVRLQTKAILDILQLRFPRSSYLALVLVEVGSRMCMTCSIGASAATEHCCTPCQALIAEIKINYLLSISKGFIHGLG